MPFKQLGGYETTEEAERCAQFLQVHGIQCVLRHRGKGLFGDSLMDEMTWLDVPEEDFDRAKQLFWPETDHTDVKLQLQCPRCRSLRVKFDVASHKTGLGKIFTWPWDKERFFCQDCRHVWDRETEPEGT